jgi:hypothetical protein
MAILVREDGTRPLALSASALIGRSLRADVKLADPLVSNVHASILWNGARWELLDHSSRNGTRLDGKLLEPGRSSFIARDSVVEFGTPRERWTFREDGPPSPFAVALDGTIVVGTESMIALPSLDTPDVTAFQASDQSWVVEEAGVLRQLETNTTVVAANTAWTIYLPILADRTVEATRRSRKPSIRESCLRFCVSRDEERVEICLEHSAGTIALPSRAHGYMLLTLARKLLDDAEFLPTSERGWIHRDTLAKMLAVDTTHLYVSILRARKQFADAGVADAMLLIERREGSREMRIGCAQVTVVQS